MRRHDVHAFSRVLQDLLLWVICDGHIQSYSACSRPDPLLGRQIEGGIVSLEQALWALLRHQLGTAHRRLNLA